MSSNKYLWSSTCFNQDVKALECKLVKALIQHGWSKLITLLSTCLYSKTPFQMIPIIVFVVTNPMWKVRSQGFICHKDNVMGSRFSGAWKQVSVIMKLFKEKVHGTDQIWEWNSSKTWGTTLFFWSAGSVYESCLRKSKIIHSCALARHKSELTPPGPSLKVEVASTEA